MHGLIKPFYDNLNLLTQHPLPRQPPTHIPYGEGVVLPFVMRVSSSVLISSPWIGASTSSNSSSSGAVSASLTARCCPPAATQTEIHILVTCSCGSTDSLCAMLSYLWRPALPGRPPAAGPEPETPAAAGGSKAAGRQSPTQGWCFLHLRLEHRDTGLKRDSFRVPVTEDATVRGPHQDRIV